MKEDIIDNYKKLPIGKYLEICQLCNEEMEALDRQVKVIAILTDNTEEEVLNAPLMTYTHWREKSEFIFNPSKGDHSRIADVYKIGGFDLVPVKDLRKVTTGQYVDYQKYLEDKENNIVEILSVFLIPKGKTYCNDYDVIDVQEAIRENLSTHEVLSLLAFFLTSYQGLILSSLTYSEKMAKGISNKGKREKILEKIRQQMAFLSGGDGSQMLM